MNNFNPQAAVLSRYGGVALAPPATETMNLRVIGFLLLHIPLAILMSRFPALATAHALAALGLALWVAVSDRPLAHVAYAASYIVGSEVLWRMTKAAIFWEVGKFALIAIFVIALFRRKRLRPRPITLFYLALLIPSALMTIIKFGPSGSRELLSSYLSGHVALVASIWFFSALALTKLQLQRLLISFVFPVFGMASATAFGILSATALKFTDESNFETSGGFGPNQVSAALGLGALLAFLYILDDRINLKLRITIFGAMLFLAAQSAMTFSRGGLYNSAGAAILASLFLMRDAKSRFQVLGVLALVLLIGNFIILPRLDTFTGGALTARFQDTQATGRVPLIISDLEIFKDNLAFGVGLGQTKDLREDLFRSAVGHTEFTRLLAEHGIFGLLMIILLLKMAFENIVRARTPKGKALVVALFVWAILFMMNAAMRIAAPSFVLGVTFVTILSGRNDLIAQLKLRYLHELSSLIRTKRLKAKSGMQLLDCPK